jgi:RNA polymerase sigma-70 factor, ECF subfamily
LTTRQHQFEDALMPYFDAAYNLARWLTGDAADADDVVQEAYLKAYTHFDSCQAANPRAWLFAIVRNTCFDWMRKRRSSMWAPLEDEIEDTAAAVGTPEAEFFEKLDRKMLRAALERLAPEYREILVLREFEELAYRDIAEIVRVPIGTVMSRLARARKRLREELGKVEAKGNAV